MNGVFDYLRLALKGRTKTPGQRLRASQLSCRMPGRLLLLLLRLLLLLLRAPDLNTTVALSILVTEPHIHHRRRRRCHHSSSSSSIIIVYQEPLSPGVSTVHSLPPAYS